MNKERLQELLNQIAEEGDSRRSPEPHPDPAL